MSAPRFFTSVLKPPASDSAAAVFIEKELNELDVMEAATAAKTLIGLFFGSVCLFVIGEFLS